MQMALSRRFCTAKCMRKYVKQKLDDDKLENGNRKCVINFFFIAAR